MSIPYPMCEAWRGPVLENVHLGHAVVCDATGDIVQAWGDPNAVMLPRSSCKMIQALPLITSGLWITRRNSISSELAQLRQSHA